MPFFLVSQNYPNSAFDYDPCTVTFFAKDAIRAAIYDLITINTVRFKGFDLSQQPVDISLRFEPRIHIGKNPIRVPSSEVRVLKDNMKMGRADPRESKCSPKSGKHVTDDEPLALYFTNTLQVSFAFADTPTSYRRGLYVLVDSYSRKMNSTQPCLNEGNFVLDTGEKIPIGTINFGNETYASYMKCSYLFENNRKNHQIAIGMESETEKCCDVLLIGGLAPPPGGLYNYQGFIQPVFQFASTNRVSLEFTSDGTVEGVGFSGNVYNIDCTCNSGNRYLSEEFRFLQLTSPGLLSGAPTYCPNISCYWIIKFSTEYEIVSRISTLSLRSYMEQDLLTIMDRFGRVMLRANSDVTGPKEMITTSGELSLNFTTSPTTAFPLSAIQPGFVIEITLFKKNVRRKKIILTDDNFLVEISTKSFHEGLNITYEYALSARPGNTVTVYFLTTLKDVVNLDIYDGPDTAATMIDPRILYENFTQDGEPMNVVSSQQHLLIRIRPNLYNTETNLDFRAMVTDWQQDRKCPPMLWSASTVLQTDAIRLTGTDCLSIFHVNKDYEPSIGITVELEKKSSLSHIALFKDLTTNISNLVMSGHDRQYPNFIYGMYVVMFYNSTQNNSVTYSWRRGSFATTLLMSPNESGIIMSEDYLPAFPLPSFEQQFSIELVAESHLMSGIKIEFLRAPGQGHGTFQFQQYNRLLDDIT
ncbi:unnamed protein product [Angiostrongylus costaricensis]|uniref:CUB domain-containing protein n=1 Tax=Angiostrongylus costaricensis TaxID=334426 RepID=A0A158PDQ2_ANGCS|nr:unnamed protein product [Angiostrongylus costaricensis]